MKKATLRRLMIVCFVAILALGLNAGVSATQCDNVIEGYMEYMGGRTWYRIINPEKKAIPLILIHGGPAASHFYLEPLEALGNERPVIVYDQQGCGFSDPLPDPAHWTIEFFVGELNQLIRKLDLKRYHLLGQSWGTVVAGEYALTEPKGLVSIIFAGPVFNVPRFIEDARVLLKGLPEELQEIIYWSEENGIYDAAYDDAAMEYYKLYVCRLDPWPEPLWKTLEYLNPDIYAYMWGPAEFTVTGTLKDYDLTSELHRIKIPTLFTCGEFDECTPGATKSQQRLVPHSQLKIFKGCAHEVHLEKPEEYNRTVSRFLRKVEHKKHK